MSNCRVCSTAEEAVRPGLVKGQGICGFPPPPPAHLWGILGLEIIQEIAVALRGKDILWMEDGAGNFLERAEIKSLRAGLSQ